MSPAKTALFFLLAGTVWGQTLDSAYALYGQGVRNWQPDFFWNAIKTAERLPDSCAADAALLKGLCFWRLTVIASLTGQEKSVAGYAERTGGQLLDYEQKKGASVLSTAVKALAFQTLASQGVRRAIKNGPKAAEAAEWLRKQEPAGYWTRLVTALNQLGAPSFAGGDPDKALAGLQAMAKDYPDSIAVSIHLAQAYSKLKKETEAKNVLRNACRKWPNDLWVKKTMEAQEKP